MVIKKLLSIILLLVMMFFTASFALKEPEKPGRYSLHQVKAGETLWGIAAKYMPEVDPRTAIEWIVEANGMRDDCIIWPGDILNVPDWNGSLEEPLGPWYSSPEAAMAAEKELQRLLQNN